MTLVTQKELLTTSMPGEFAPLVPMINGDPKGKDVLTMRQFTADDIYSYIEEAEALERIFDDDNRRGINLLPFVTVRVLMRQPSTRTDGSFEMAADKIGASVHSPDMKNTSEEKDESPEDSAVAFATQSDLIVVRDKVNGQPELMARAIQSSYDLGKLKKRPPVINAGDGTNEHTSQALGDYATIKSHQGLDSFEGETLGVIGDLERYRADHSLMLGAKALGMKVYAYECEAAPVPPLLAEELGDSLERVGSLSELLANVRSLYVGRNPKEYKGDNEAEARRSAELSRYYSDIVINIDRLASARTLQSVLHPRPRGPELHISIDSDPRAADVMQMEKMIPMRGAILVRAMGKSVLTKAA